MSHQLFCRLSLCYFRSSGEECNSRQTFFAKLPGWVFDPPDLKRSNLSCFRLKALKSFEERTRMVKKEKPDPDSLIKKFFVWD